MTVLDDKDAFQRHNKSCALNNQLSFWIFFWRLPLFIHTTLLWICLFNCILIFSLCYDKVYTVHYFNGLFWSGPKKKQTNKKDLNLERVWLNFNFLKTNVHFVQTFSSKMDIVARSHTYIEADRDFLTDASGVFKFRIVSLFCHM